MPYCNVQFLNICNIINLLWSTNSLCYFREFGFSMRIEEPILDRNFICTFYNLKNIIAIAACCY